jgi:parallel beta-helix repeat protein
MDFRHRRSVEVGMRMSRALPAVVLAAAPLRAAAATITVPDDQPTIQAAVDAARSGDVVVVVHGAHGGFTVDGRTALTIKGKGKPIVDGAGAAITVVTVRGSQDIVLDGFVIQGSSERLLDILASQDVTIRRCTFTAGFDALRAHDGSTGVRVEKNTFTNIAHDGVAFTADETPSPATDSRITKNRFENVGADAIALEGSGHVVEKNRIHQARASGIISDAGDSHDITIARNRIETTTHSGILCNGTGHTIEKNTLKSVGTGGEEGIQLRGTGHRVAKNKIDTVGDDGIDVEASGCEIVSNRVKNAGDGGFEIGEIESPGDASGNRFERNKITGSGGAGIHVLDTGNTFTRNKAGKSGGFDLLDETTGGGNVYEKNKFGTQQVPS